MNTCAPLLFRRSFHGRAGLVLRPNRAARSSTSFTRGPRREPLIDASARDNAVMVGNPLAWAT